MSESAGDWDTKGVRAFKSKAPEDHWVATEKIHGANFSLVATTNGVRCAKRDTLLDEQDTTFYAGHRDIHHRYANSVQQLFHAVSSTEAHLATVTIYGELFGGRYPIENTSEEFTDEPETTEDNTTATAIQQGVWYSPTLQWSAFDVAFTLSDDSRRYLPYREMAALLAAHSIPHAAPLLIAPFQSCVNFPLPFQTTIPKIFDLPALPQNDAEGVVIRPYAVEVEVMNMKGKRVRAVLKVKAERFAELSDKKTVRGLAGASDVAVLCAMCVNANRLAAVLSKTGRLTKRNRAEVTARLVDDVVEEVARKSPGAKEADIRKEAAPQVNAFMAKQK